MRIHDRRTDQPDTERVHGRAALPHFEMEVRSGRQAARPNIADQLPAADEAAGRGDDLAHVAVAADEAAAMRDLDLAAVAAGPARADHLAVARGDDRAAPASADVDARVEA